MSSINDTQSDRSARCELSFSCLSPASFRRLRESVCVSSESVSSAGASCAGAYFAEQGVRYLCVAGTAVQGDRTAPRRSVQRYAHSAYSQVRRLPQTEPAMAL